MKRSGWLLVLTLVAMLAAPAPAAAQDAGAPPAAQADGAIPAGTFAMLMRFGGGGASSSGSFTFDEVPANFEDSSAFVEGFGHTNAGAVDLMWFLTRSRKLVLGVTGERSQATAVINYENEDDYGYALLHNKHITFTNTAIMFHIGCRWLYGASDQYASTLHLKFGPASSDIMIDGVVNTSSAFGGVFELGSAFYRRFDNGMFAGVQADLRGSSAEATAVEMKVLNTDADIVVGSGTLLMSVLFGWETF
jgi:hypothetical protein